MQYILMILLCLTVLDELAGAVSLPTVQPGVIAQNPVGGGSGASLGFVEYIPTDYNNNSSYPHPLIIQLHGNGLQGSNLNNVITKRGATKIANEHLLAKNNAWTQAWDFDDYAGSRSAILLAPLLPSGGTWNAPRIEQVQQIVAAMIADPNRNIDENRIYVVGYSLGGGGIWNYGNLYGDKIAAAAGIAPATINLGGEFNLTRMSNMKVWVIQALNDNTSKWWWPRDQMTYMAVFANDMDWGIPKLMASYPGGEGKVFGTGDPIGNYPGADHPTSPGKHYTAWFVDAATGWQWNQAEVDDAIPDGWHTDGVGVPPAGADSPLRFTMLYTGGHGIANQGYQNPDVWDWLFDQTLTGAPITPPGPSIIIDNSGAELVTDGATWTLSNSTAGFVGDDYLVNFPGSSGPRRLTYILDIPQAGRHEMFMRWPIKSDRSPTVKVVIDHAGGSTELTIDQRVNGDDWYSLGEFDFGLGKSGSLSIYSTGAPGEGFVIADAIGLTRVGDMSVVGRRISIMLNQELGTEVERTSVADSPEVILPRRDAEAEIMQFFPAVSNVLEQTFRLVVPSEDG